MLTATCNVLRCGLVEEFRRVRGSWCILIQCTKWQSSREPKWRSSSSVDKCVYCELILTRSLEDISPRVSADLVLMQRFPVFALSGSSFYDACSIARLC